MKKFLVLRHIKVSQANAFSSPYTAGFPAVTSFLGFAENFSRKLKASGLSDADFPAVAIICHSFALKSVRRRGYLAPTGTANPPGKDGKRPSFIPEIRCDMDISLILRMERGDSLLDLDQDPARKGRVKEHLLSMRLSSGSVDEIEDTVPFAADERDPSDWKPILMKLMPGYALLDRRSLVRDEMLGGKDAMDVILDYCSLSGARDQGEPDPRLPVKSGWIVPLAVGYQGISPVSLQAVNTRDPETPHRFAEAVISLGEFKMIHRIKDFSEIFWTCRYKEESSLYLCENGL